MNEKALEKALYIESCLENVQQDDVDLVKRHIEEYELMVAHASQQMTAYDVQNALAKQRMFRDRLEAMMQKPRFSSFRFVQKKKKQEENKKQQEENKEHRSNTCFLTVQDRKDEDDVTCHFKPESPSLMVNNVVNCMVNITGYRGQQIRIHSSRDSTFTIYHDTESRKEECATIIIEHCENLRFAFVGGPPVDIQDFGWLKSTPSPNFSIVVDTV